MTNEEIILKESERLVQEGILKTVEIDGEEIPEPIHTYQKWKALGYKVKKGEKSTIKIPIWKYTSKTVTIDNKEVLSSATFMKTAAFFTRAQVEKIG